MAAATESRAQDRRVLVGRVSGLFGVKGWLKVFSYTDPVTNIFHYGPWELRHDGAQTIRELAEAREHGKGLVARLAGIEDRDDAQRLIGADIFVPRSRFEATEDGQYYWDDLVGMQVVTASGEGLGRVEQLVETGAHDVMVIGGDRRRLVPFVMGDVVQSVSLEDDLIVVDWSREF